MIGSVHRLAERSTLSEGSIAGEVPASHASIDEIGLMMAGAHRDGEAGQV